MIIMVTSECCVDIDIYNTSLATAEAGKKPAALYV